MNRIGHANGRRLSLGSAALLVAALVPLAATAAAQPFVTVTQVERNGTVYAKAKGPSSGTGWQASYKYSVPEGKNLTFMYICPNDGTLPVNGSFNPNATARVGLSLVANFRPGSPGTEWEWSFDWPKGAPANSVIYFNVYCTT